MPPPSLNKIIKFGPHVVTPQVFHLTTKSFCLVNIRPLLPGHILVSPLRSVQHLSSLTSEETTDLFLTVQKVSRTLKRVYNASAFNVAVQDGEAAGQSVAHVHCHVIPRKEGDMDSRGGGDKLYEMMEGEDGNIGGAFEDHEGEKKKKRIGVGKRDNVRKDRTAEEMRAEAEWLAEEMEKDAADEKLAEK